MGCRFVFGAIAFSCLGLKNKCEGSFFFVPHFLFLFLTVLVKSQPAQTTVSLVTGVHLLTLRMPTLFFFFFFFPSIHQVNEVRAHRWGALMLEKGAAAAADVSATAAAAVAKCKSDDVRNLGKQSLAMDELLRQRYRTSLTGISI